MEGNYLHLVILLFDFSQDALKLTLTLQKISLTDFRLQFTRNCKVISMLLFVAWPISSYFYIPDPVTNKISKPWSHLYVCMNYCFLKYYSLTLLSIVSLSLVRSSMAASQFCIRISEASLPHKELKAFLSVEGTWAESNKISVSKSDCAVVWRPFNLLWPVKSFSIVSWLSYQDSEEVEVLCSPRVVTTLVLEFGVPVQSVQVLLTKLRHKKTRNIQIKAH